jgi:hypothetical protein
MNGVSTAKLVGKLFFVLFCVFTILSLNRHGNPVKVTTIPDRTKGMVSYGGDRTGLSKQIITEQVYDIAEKLFRHGVSFDEKDADWMIANNYVLPPLWHPIARPWRNRFPPGFVHRHFVNGGRIWAEKSAPVV